MPCRARHPQFSRYVSGGIIHDTHGEECKRAAPVRSSARNPPVKVVFAPSLSARPIQSRRQGRVRGASMRADGDGGGACVACVRGAPRGRRNADRGRAAVKRALRVRCILRIPCILSAPCLTLACIHCIHGHSGDVRCTAARGLKTSGCSSSARVGECLAFYH